MTLTRRTALAAPALLALPSAALARQAEPDPALAAFETWRAAHMASRQASDVSVKFVTTPADVEALWDDAYDAEKEALDRIAATRATTLQGIALQLRALSYSLGFDFATNDLPHDPCVWSVADFPRTDYAGDFELAALMGVWRVIEATEAMAGGAQLKMS